MQKISIQNNGPVSEFEMEVKCFNFLIGEQATGKSTIAKSVYFFRLVKTTVINYLIQVCDNGTYNNQFQGDMRFDRVIRKELKRLFVKLFGYSWELNPKMRMRYEFTENIWLEVALEQGVRQNRQFISVYYSKKLYERISTLENEVIELYNSDLSVVTSLALTNERRKRNHELIIQKVNEIFEDDRETYYIPAGRSLLTVMSGNRATMNSVSYLDLVTEQFMMMIDSVRNSFNLGVKKAHQYYPVEQRKFDVNDMVNYIVDIQKGEYFFNNGKEVLKIDGNMGHPIEINFASSGQQEILWVLNFLYILMLKEEKAFVIIEEPEAHIYPALQKKLIEFIAMYANLQNGSVFITTHSPYVLTAANNLYYAGVLAKEGNQKAVGRIVDKNKTICAGELSAYKLWNHTSGSMEKCYTSLFDESQRELLTGMIDDVSEKINEEYTALYQIELERE